MRPLRERPRLQPPDARRPGHDDHLAESHEAGGAGQRRAGLPPAGIFEPEPMPRRPGSALTRYGLGTPPMARTSKARLQHVQPHRRGAPGPYHGQKAQRNGIVGNSSQGAIWKDTVKRVPRWHNHAMSNDGDEPRQPTSEQRERTRRWIERNANKHPVDWHNDEEMKDAAMLSPLDDDQKERIARWRDATMRQRGAALASLLRFVEKAGRFPEKEERFPGFPKKRPSST